MNNNNLVVVAVALSFTSYKQDGRKNRRANEIKYSIRSCTWSTVQDDPLYEGWFKLMLRCSKKTFEIITERITIKWEEINNALNYNTCFWIRDRVACYLHYVAHPGGFFESGQVFGTFVNVLGISSTSCKRYVKQVMNVINLYTSGSIKLPSTPEEWKENISGFENFGGIPNCCLAIDGSLIIIKRRKDFEGWYCRKGFPAFNLQAVVDHKKRFCSYSLRSGSQNDKNLFNNSQFGRTIQTKLPNSCFIIGDAGYTLYNHLMIPYSIYPGMPFVESNFNYLHSKTRIVVEQAFALLKNKFRIFKTELLWNDPHEIGRLINSILIIHNWLINFNEEEGELLVEEWMEIGLFYPDRNIIAGEEAKLKRDRIANYLLQ